VASALTVGATAVRTTYPSHLSSTSHVCGVRPVPVPVSTRRRVVLYSLLFLHRTHATHFWFYALRLQSEHKNPLRARAFHHAARVSILHLNSPLGDRCPTRCSAVGPQVQVPRGQVITESLDPGFDGNSTVDNPRQASWRQWKTCSAWVGVEDAPGGPQGTAPPEAVDSPVGH